MDVLTDLLQRSRARGAAFSRSTVHGAWGVEFPLAGALAIHAIVDGEMVAWTAEAPHDPVRVSGGDVLLLRANPHFLASHADHPTMPFGAFMQRACGEDGPGMHLRAGDPADGPAAEFCCGAYRFEGDLSRPLLDALPPLVRLRPQAGSPLRLTIDLLAAELLGSGPGQQALLDRLLDVALVQALRTWFGSAAEVPGWFRAMDEPGPGAALRAIHADPARPWTVGELAAIARQSRSAFARRFAEVVGAPPLEYLTDWRIALAKEHLRDSSDGLAAIAASVGYASEFSFAAAFKRRVGTAPGQWRRAAVSSRTSA